MIYGVRAHDYGKNTPAGLFASIAADGWQTIQLAIKKAIDGVNGNADITKALLDEIDVKLQKNSLVIAVLGAYIEPSLVDEDMRRKQVKTFCEQLVFAKALHAGCIGTETTNMAIQPGVSRKEALVYLRKSLEEILPKAEELGVLVAVEPVYYHAMATPEDTCAILRDMQSPNLRVIFDPVNILAPEEVETQHALWQRAMDCFGEKIIAVHVKGVALKDGVLVKTNLEQSVVDYGAVFSLLNQLGRSLPLLREEAVPQHAAQDIAFIKSFF